MRTAWASLKTSLQRRCKSEKLDLASERKRSYTCCYAYRDQSPITCQTPWMLSDVMVRPPLRTGDEAVHCYGGNETFIPELKTTHPTVRKWLSYMFVYNVSLGLDNCVFADIDRTNKWALNRPNASTTLCCTRIGQDLECSFLWRADVRRAHFADRNVTLRTKGFFQRTAYHLFSSVNKKLLSQSRESLMRSTTVYGSLLRQSLGIGDLALTGWG